MMTAIDTLVEAGFPPEAVLLELYLSGELAYSFEKIRQVGLVRQMDFHSHTSQYGTLTRSAKFLDLDPSLRARMQEVLDEIRSGAFAKEWSGAQAESTEMFERVRALRAALPMAGWEDTARAAFRIGDAVAPTTGKPPASVDASTETASAPVRKGGRDRMMN
jgi:ketol-acid reductoisomerase